MKQFELNGKQYQLPTSWNEVTYRQAKQIIPLYAEGVEIDLYERAATIVAILTGIDYDYLTSFEISLVIDLFYALNFISEQGATPIEHFKFNGSTYYVNDLENEIFKSFVTYHRIEKMFEDEPVEIILHKMALLCRKQGETIADMEANDSKLMKERAEMFNDLPASVVMGVDAFFLSKLVLYATHTNLYTEAVNQHQVILQKYWEITTPNGTGKGWLSGLRKKLGTWVLSIIKKRAKSSLG